MRCTISRYRGVDFEICRSKMIHPVLLTKYQSKKYAPMTEMVFQMRFLSHDAERKKKRDFVQRAGTTREIYKMNRFIYIY